MTPSLARSIDAAKRRDAAESREGPTVLCVTLRLTRIPPSLNNAYFNRTGGGRGASVEHKNWMETAGKEIRFEQRVPMITGPIRVHYQLERPNASSDIGNREKLLSDALVNFGVIENDNLIEGIVIEWADVKGVQIEVRSVSGITTRGRVAA